jgi:uncharacterized protein YndB with AHSA1/START domain
MSPPRPVHRSFTVERHYPQAPHTVFAAFADPARKRRWFAEGEGFAVDAYELDFRVGGLETAHFRFRAGLPVPEGTACENRTWYCDIVTDERIVCAYTMTIAGSRISASLATFEFIPDDGGTRLVFTEQAAFFDNADGPEQRELGWRSLFDRLASELAS